MKKNFLPIFLEKGKGLTLIEVLISLIILTVILLSCLFVFKESVVNFRKSAYEKEITKQAVETLLTIEKLLKNAKINNLKGSIRMNFKGDKTSLKFISITEESQKSDYMKVGIYLKNGKIKMHVEKIKPDDNFTFKYGFPGAQTLCENVKSFEIFYFDGKDYLSQWNTEKMENPKLPSFIKLKMEIESKDKIEGEKVVKKFERIIKVGYE